MLQQIYAKIDAMEQKYQALEQHVKELRSELDIARDRQNERARDTDGRFSFLEKEINLLISRVGDLTEKIGEVSTARLTVIGTIIVALLSTVGTFASIATNTTNKENQLGIERLQNQIEKIGDQVQRLQQEVDPPEARRH